MCSASKATSGFLTLLSGNQTFTTAAVGSATYSETVQFSGTLRARLGYAAGNWLFYLTGGFAWSFDQFARCRALRQLNQAFSNERWFDL